MLTPVIPCAAFWRKLSWKSNFEGFKTDNHPMGKLEFTIDGAMQRDPILGEFYKCGGADGTVNFAEAKGMVVPGAIDGHTIQTAEDFLKLEASVRIYQRLSQNHTSRLTGMALWEYSQKSLNGFYHPEFFQTQDSLSVSEPVFSETAIDIVLTHDADGSEFAHIHFDVDPDKTNVAMATDEVYDMNSFTRPWAVALLGCAENTNTILARPSHAFQKEKFRQIIFDNVETLHQGWEAGRYKNAVPTSVIVHSETQTTLSDQLQFNHNKVRTVGSLRGDFTSVQEFSWQQQDFPIFSNSKISPEHMACLTEVLWSFPLPLQEFYREKPVGSETFGFIVLSAEEYKKYIKNPGVVAQYDRTQKLIYISDEFFAEDAPLDTRHAFLHEFCHATLDVMANDRWRDRLSGAVLAEAADKIDDLTAGLPEDTADQVIAGIGAALTTGAVLASVKLTPQAMKVVTKHPLIAAGLLAAGAAVFGTDEALHDPIDEEGLLLRDFASAQQRVAQGEMAGDVTVSNYALEDGKLKEFACETLLAYLCTEEYVLETGYYNTDPAHGLKTQEELMLKHPAIYLAYEVYFSSDSPQQYQADIFMDEEMIKILDESLAYNRRADGSYNVKKARAALFAVLPDFTARTEDCGMAEE